MPKKNYFTFDFSGLGRFFRADDIGIFCLDNRLSGNREMRDLKFLEDIIRRYKKNGISFLTSLGDFCGVVIYDFDKDVLLAASDKVGHFPFYFAVNNNRILVSDRIAFFLKEGFKDFSRRSFESYLSLGYIGGAESIVAGVRKVPPGHCLCVRRGLVQLRKYHTFSVKERYEKREWYSASFKKNLKDTVRTYAQNGKLGLMLSGGFDSTLLCHAISRECRSFHTFTLGLASTNDETIRQSRKIAGLFGARHHEIYFTLTDYVTNFPKALASLDEPVFDMDISLIYHALKNIPSDIPFIFHGFGSDEMFGDRLRSHGKVFSRQDTASYATQKLPQELILHDRVGEFFHPRLIFPFLNHDMLRLGLSMPRRYKHNKDVVRNLEPALYGVAPRVHLPPGRVPDVARKALRVFYAARIEKSPLLIDALGKKYLKKALLSEKNALVLPLIVFWLWCEQKKIYRFSSLPSQNRRHPS